MRTTANPLSVNFGFLGNHREIVPGSKPELYVSIKNRGGQNAVIDLSVEVTDEDSAFLSQWISPRRIRLALNAEEDKTVTFQIQIPDNAWPHNYHYDVILDSPEHYPEYTPLHYPQVLKVLPTPATTKHGVDDPSFFLSPVTTSTKPKQIKPGETFAVEVLVENRTSLVDRFHLICSDLKSEYFSVYYPEIRDQYGLVVEGDGLELNPGKQGKIVIQFHPPYDAPAGNYYPTIRLASVNNPRLNLLDVVYLNIPPAYGLEVDIETIKDRIKDLKIDSGEFLVQIANQGNVERSLIVKSRNRGWGGLKFTIDPDFTTLAPGARSQINMLVKPIGRWWNRPFYGVGRDFRFGVELEDMRNLPLPQEMPQSKVTWEPYPRKWFIFFIVLLSLLGAGGAIALAILIWNLFLKQPPPPEVVELAPAKTIFKEADNETIQLNWTIRNAKSIDRIVLSQQGSNANETKTFNFKEGTKLVLPVDLDVRSQNQTDNYCSFQTNKKETNLVCRGITTSARKPGQYQFELQVFNQKTAQKPVSVLKTDTIRIAPAGVPKIAEFVSEKTEYFIDTVQNSGSFVLLNWEITNPAQIGQIQLVGLAQDGTVASSPQRFDIQDGALPKPLQAVCKFGNSLVCRNVPINVRKAGRYTFRLSVEPKHGGEERNIIKVTDAIPVKAIPSVKIPTRRLPDGTSIPAVPSQPGQLQPSISGQSSDRPGELIDPSLWPSPNISSGNEASGSGYRPPPSPPISAERQQSIQHANDVSRGLLVANDIGEIKTHSATWKKVQDAIYFLRSGNTLAIAAKKSGVSRVTLNQLITWGRGKDLPPKDSPKKEVTKPSSLPRPTKYPVPNDVVKPPEPIWGKSEKPVKSDPKAYGGAKSEPLW
jgi:hypothetical protein